MMTALTFLALAQAAVPSAPVMRDPFFVFFDSKSATIAVQARGILDNIVTAARSTGAVRIEVRGHADRQGSSAYNLQLSRRRAEAIKAALVARGLSGRAITTEALGEARPIVETQDGVAEAHNRYATVLIY